MNLVLVVVDSLRHDALGCLGGQAVTPTMDSLAARAIVFERVVSAAPWTVPSIASMLTGVYSHRLGLAKWDQPWPRHHPNLFGLAARSGFEVASFVFDPTHLFCRVPEAGVKGSSQDTAALLSWMHRPRPPRSVLFVHYWWTHVPYVSSPMTTPVWRQVTDRVLASMRTGGAAAREGVKGLYRLAVERFSEKWWPRVAEAIDLDSSWLVITSDHGESWGERAETAHLADVFDLHGNTLYDEVLRVPLIIRPPGGCAGRRIRDLTRTVDLLPTLADLAGLGELTDLDGSPWRRPSAGRRGPPPLTRCRR